jgi:hypothetical protein
VKGRITGWKEYSFEIWKAWVLILTLKLRWLCDLSKILNLSVGFFLGSSLLSIVEEIKAMNRESFNTVPHV